MSNPSLIINIIIITYIELLYYKKAPIKALKPLFFKKYFTLRLKQGDGNKMKATRIPKIKVVFFMAMWAAALTLPSLHAENLPLFTVTKKDNSKVQHEVEDKLSSHHIVGDNNLSFVLNGDDYPHLSEINFFRSFIKSISSFGAIFLDIKSILKLTDKDSYDFGYCNSKKVFCNYVFQKMVIPLEFNNQIAFRAIIKVSGNKCPFSSTENLKQIAATEPSSLDMESFFMTCKENKIELDALTLIENHRTLTGNKRQLFKVAQNLFQNYSQKYSKSSVQFNKIQVKCSSSSTSVKPLRGGPAGSNSSTADTSCNKKINYNLKITHNSKEKIFTDSINSLSFLMQNKSSTLFSQQIIELSTYSILNAFAQKLIKK